MGYRRCPNACKKGGNWVLIPAPFERVRLVGNVGNIYVNCGRWAGHVRKVTGGADG